MSDQRTSMYNAPLFLGTAFLLFGLAVVEKLLNLLGANLPFIAVFPRQLLEWAVTLLIFEIALTLRQQFDAKLP